MIDGFSRMTLAATTAVLVSLAAPASATVSRFLDIHEHTELSQLVVRATTSSETRSFVGKDGIPRIETRFTVLETYKGSAQQGASIWLRQFGGGEQLGMLPIVGDATFTPGEEVVLFLTTSEEGVVFLTALSQSKFEVVRGDRLPIVTRNIGGLAFYQPGVKGGIFSITEDAPISLELFSQTVREIATSPAP